METLSTIITIMLVVISLAIIFVVLIQKSSSGGAGSVFGSDTASFTQKGKAAGKEAKLKKMASDVDWDEVTGKNWMGEALSFSLNSDGSVHVTLGDYIDADYDPEELLEEVDIFDAQGNMISNHKDYR